MDVSETELIRYSKPTKFDAAPFGSIWRYVDENDIYTETYVQTDNKERLPKWTPIGIVLAKAFQEFIHDDDFMKECLRLYVYNSNRPLLTISNLIKKKEKEYSV